MISSIGIVAYVLAWPFGFLNHLIIAVFLGMVIGNSVGMSANIEKGVQTHKLWLETGIVIMGATIAVDQIATIGSGLLLLLIGVIGTGILLVELVSRVAFDLERELSSLVASGMSICGVSAVIAVAGSIKANERHIAYAISAVLIMDTVTMFVYPLIGVVLALPDRVFGIWAGISMLSTGPASAAGFAYSTEAGEWATVTKVARNAFIGIVAVAYSTIYATNKEAPNVGTHILSVWSTFPKFILGFIIFILLSLVGVFSESHIRAFDNIYTALFTIAFAGLGLQIKVSNIRNTGLKPLVLLTGSFIVMSLISLVTVHYIFG